MAVISSYTAATGMTDDDVLPGNDGSTTVKFPASVVKSYVQASLTANTQTGSYTAVLADAGKLVVMNVASTNNFTVPPNSSVAFPTGTVIDVVQYGAGATTIVAGSGVTINKPATQSLVLAERYASATLVKLGTNEWLASGMLT